MFRNPERLEQGRQRHREERQHFIAFFGSDLVVLSTVLGYLESPTISPLAFRRLAEPDPARATRVFRRVLRRPGFSWERDGGALLR